MNETKSNVPLSTCAIHKNVKMFQTHEKHQVLMGMKRVDGYIYYLEEQFRSVW